jgi:hypothetical protein
LFAAYVDGNNFFLIQFRENGDNGRFEVFNYSSAYDWRVETNALLRDPSAWYHIVVALDTTQATDSNRIKIYVNGTLQTLATTTYPSLNFDSDANNNIAHYIGQDGGNGRYHNGYLTEVNFIDGSAKTPSDFGETDSATGVWKPKTYSGTYGTNGFYLKFADNSGTTSTTLGKDSSGNSNNWTPNNFSVTAGTGNDSMVDSPTSYGTDTGVGGEVRGNYPTLNPLSKSSGSVITNGNLDWSSTTYNYQGATSTICLPSSGKWYWETNITTGGTAVSDDFGVGVQSLSFGTFPRDSGGANGITDGAVYVSRRDIASRLVVNNSAVQQSNTYSFSTGDVVQVAYDASTGKIWFGRNNTWWDASGGSTGNPSSGTNPVGTLTAGGLYLPVWDGYTNTWVVAVNFGQRAFAYTAPSGFKALCTTNLPTPTIGATSTTLAGKYFNPIIYTGTGSVRSLTGVGFQPDLVWIKGRSQATGHGLFNSVIGATKGLSSNSNAAQFTDVNSLTAFNSDGFSLGTDATNNFVNVNTQTYVAWNWNAGGSNATNTAGTITSTVRANTTSGFSVVSFNAGSAGNKTVGHGLGASLNLWIMKSLSTANNSWSVGSSALATPASNYLVLNGTAASTSDTRLWANAAPTSTVFSFESNYTVPANADCIAYCFAAISGFSAFGSYTGNGSADGPFVYLGFRPRFVIVKRTSGIEKWYMMDTARDTDNPIDITQLVANASDAEGTFTAFDFTSNGFKNRTSNVMSNGNGDTYIYMAFAENPFKYSLAR